MYQWGNDMYYLILPVMTYYYNALFHHEKKLALLSLIITICRPSLLCNARYEAVINDYIESITSIYLLIKECLNNTELSLSLSVFNLKQCYTSIDMMQ